MISFAIRNIKVFFRDKASVFFSLLSVILIIALYALFLGDVWTKSMSDQILNPRTIMDSWLMSGILSVISLTATMGAIGTMVDDKVKKIFKDFASSPLKRTSVVGGYIISSFVIGMIMSIVAFICLDFFLLIKDGYVISFLGTIECLGLMFLSTMSSTAFVLFITSFFRSQGAFATASTLIGTLVGFLAGIYMPVGSFADPIQIVIKCIPLSHSASLFRQIIMNEPLNSGFAGIPNEYRVEFEKMMGVTFSIGDFTFLPYMQVLIVFGSAVLFYLLAFINISKKQK